MTFRHIVFVLAAFILHPRAQAVPGLSAARRNTRGFHSVNQGLAPNSRKLISHACPEAVPFSTRAPSLLFVVVSVLHTSSLVLFLSLAVFILDRLHRLRWPSPLPRLRFLLCSFGAPSSLDYRSDFLPSWYPISATDRRRTTAILVATSTSASLC